MGQAHPKTISENYALSDEFCGEKMLPSHLRYSIKEPAIMG